MVYVPLARDTTRDAEHYQFKRLREAGGCSRLALCARLTRCTKELCLAELEQRESDAETIRHKVAQALLGFEPARFLPMLPGLLRISTKIG